MTSVQSRHYPEAAKRFSGDVAEHAMTVLHDDGLYRHLRFKRPGTFSYFFDIVTWPGCLTVRGDMGTFTWARIEDMLEFFTSGTDINPGYWEEKLQGGGRSDTRAYNASTFRWMVGQAYQEFRDQHPDHPALADLWQQLRDDVLDEVAEWGQAEAISAALRFQHDATGFTMADAYEWSVTDHSIFYLWCCFAARWGAQQYAATRLAVAA